MSLGSFYVLWYTVCVYVCVECAVERKHDVGLGERIGKMRCSAREWVMCLSKYPKYVK